MGPPPYGILDYSPESYPDLSPGTRKGDGGRGLKVGGLIFDNNNEGFNRN